MAELTELVGLDMSTVSNHLAVLRNGGLLEDERRGTQIFYALKTPCPRVSRAWCYGPTVAPCKAANPGRVC